MARRAADLRDLDGILLLDKPAGPSSNQVLQHVRRLLRARKAGHAGTLDPLATGLLPILFGEATKFAGSLSDADKAYEATVWFGVTTTTGDLAGDICTRHAVSLSIDQVREVAARFLGDVNQVPPMHSALKVQGRPLYERARKGESVERASRLVRISEFSIDRLRRDECDVRVRCSKGTYIRTLAEDLGAALGCGATLKTLRRTMVGAFDVSCAVPLDALKSLEEPFGRIQLLPVDAALKHLPSMRLAAPAAEQILKGQPVMVEADTVSMVTIYAADSNRFLGTGSVDAGVLRARRLIAA